MAKKARVYDGTAWQELASAQTDLTAYSTTAQMNTAITAGPRMTLLSTTTLSGASTVVSSISQAYADLEIWVYGMTNATGNSGPNFRPNSTINLIHAAGSSNVNGTLALVGINNSNIQTANSGLRTDANNAVKIRIQNYASTTNHKNLEYVMSFASTSSTPITEQYVGVIKTNSAITSMEFVNGGGNWSTGTVQVWGS